MKKSKALLLVLAAALLSTSPVFGWNARGHEAVAAIAWDNMQPATQKKVTEILNAAKAGDCLHELGTGFDARTFFIKAATWPDVVRPGDNDTRPCTKFHDRDAHFFDHFWSGVSGGKDDEAPKALIIVPKKRPTTNAIERVYEFRPLVACKKTPCCGTPADRAHDLAWMLHLVGDIHQPLHNAARVTTEPKEKEGDHGGNLFLLKKGTIPDNLHSFWDEIIDESIPRNGEAEMVYINRVIKQIQADHPKASLAARMQSGDVGAWSAEGLATAERMGYPKALQRGETPSDEYRKAVFTVADEAIALGGYRLADLLDNMFGTAANP